MRKIIPNKPEVFPLLVEEPVKTSPTDYEAEMDKPVWEDEQPQKKNWF